jgi:arylsulfatase A-like enzyme
MVAVPSISILVVWLLMTICRMQTAIAGGHMEIFPEDVDQSSTSLGSHEVKDSSFMLFDLSIDPFEDQDLSTNATYTEQYLDYFTARHSYWKSLSVPKNSPNTANQSSGWKACGRVCAWIADEDDYQPLQVEQIYDYADAPNIVFVLVDDWGYNDVGFRSNYISWTTPTFDHLASQGITLTNYYTNELCTPSRASFLTGRYNLRLGVYDPNAELPSSEVTIAHELQSAGYQTYLVGKWHQGQSKQSLWPLQKGFQYFYGFLNGWETYWSKTFNNYVDLFENNEYVTHEDELDHDLHNGYLMQMKAEHAIKMHHSNYDSQDVKKPFFLYYAMQLIHYPWSAPEIYLQRCVKNYEDYYVSDDHVPSEDVPYNYCAMNLMMDEAIANLTCTLEKYGYADNTIMIIAGDNGGEPTGKGNSIPFRGHKNSTLRGGTSNTAIIHSKLLPESLQGSKYSYLVHITDWLPTLMHIATNGSWTGSYVNASIDGKDLWPGLLSNKSSGREELVILSYPQGAFTMMNMTMKYISGLPYAQVDQPLVYFDEDLQPDLQHMICDDPSLVDA